MSALSTTSTQHLWFVWTCLHCVCKEVLQAPLIRIVDWKMLFVCWSIFFGVRFVPIWLIRLTQQQKNGFRMQRRQQNKGLLPNKYKYSAVRAVSILFVYHSPAFVNNMYIIIIYFHVQSWFISRVPESTFQEPCVRNVVELTVGRIDLEFCESCTQVLHWWILKPILHSGNKQQLQKRWLRKKSDWDVC